MNERARARRRLKLTKEEKRESLSKRNESNKARRKAETSAEAETRLEKKKIALAEESDQERAARLEHMRQCLAAEMPEERSARLECMSALQQQCLATETPEERATRLEHLQQNRDAHRDNSQEAHFTLLEQGIVKEKMDNFHKKCPQLSHNSLCLLGEVSCGMKMTFQSPECQRCFHDKKVPKPYSSGNNYESRDCPPELQVRHINYIYITIQIKLLDFA